MAQALARTASRHSKTHVIARQTAPRFIMVHSSSPMAVNRFFYKLKGFASKLQPYEWLVYRTESLANGSIPASRHLAMLHLGQTNDNKLRDHVARSVRPSQDYLIPDWSLSGQYFALRSIARHAPITVRLMSNDEPLMLDDLSHFHTNYIVRDYHDNPSSRITWSANYNICDIL